MVDYASSIKKPFSDMKTLGIGTILNVIPIVSLLVTGFVVKTGEDAVKGKNKLRGFALNDIVEYIVKLVIMWVISVIYMIPGLVIVAVGIGAALATLLPALTDPTNVADALSNLASSALVGAPILIVGFLLLLIACILLPMAIMRWLKEGSIGAAFNVLTVLKKVLTVNYWVTVIVYFVYAIVLAIIASIIAGILVLVPVIGWVLGLLIMGLVGFALSVTGYDLMAQVYNAK